MARILISNVVRTRAAGNLDCHNHKCHRRNGWYYLRSTLGYGLIGGLLRLQLETDYNVLTHSQPPTHHGALLTFGLGAAIGVVYGLIRCASHVVTNLMGQVLVIGAIGLYLARLSPWAHPQLFWWTALGLSVAVLRSGSRDRKQSRELNRLSLRICRRCKAAGVAIPEVLVPEPADTT